uniref:Uncharacterized protein n=1 Tax=Sphaerodactylus townsendi TaxID=933632 RepID=A0ACB8F465_9SAUR
MVNFCMGVSVGVSLTIEEALLTVGAKASYDDCSKSGERAQDASKTKSVIEDIIPRVRGGDTKSVGRLLESWNANAYRYWGRSLKLNPTIIDFEFFFCHRFQQRVGRAHRVQHVKIQGGQVIQYMVCGPAGHHGHPVNLSLEGEQGSVPTLLLKMVDLCVQAEVYKWRHVNNLA